MLKCFISIFILFFSTLPAHELREIHHPLYGSCIIKEPILIELIDSQTVQRLKSINQYGTNHYTRKKYDYTRYDHSIGVFMLLRRFGASIIEQISGLLHDTSHTAFSHIVDYLYAQKNLRGSLEVEKCKSSYQDDIFTAFIKNTDIATILSTYGLQAEDIDPHNGLFYMLEQALPDICADRLEYTLFGGYQEQLFTKQEVEFILNNIRWHNGKWCFTNHQAALIFSQASLYLTQYIFSARWNTAEYQWIAAGLRYAIDTQLITRQMLHTGTDDQLWEILCSIQDPFIEQIMTAVCSGTIETLTHLPQQHIITKFRGIDPLVEINGTCRRLSEYDSAFLKQFDQLKQTILCGVYIPDVTFLGSAHIIA